MSMADGFADFRERQRNLQRVLSVSRCEQAAVSVMAGVSGDRLSGSIDLTRQQIKDLTGVEVPAEALAPGPLHVFGTRIRVIG